MIAVKKTFKNGSTAYYIQESRRVKGKCSSRYVRSLGSDKKLREQGIEDPWAYAQGLARQMTEAKKGMKLSATVTVDGTKRLPAEGRTSREKAAVVGHLYLRYIWDRAGLDQILGAIPGKHRFSLADLTYLGSVMRIMDPQSKLKTVSLADEYVGMPKTDESSMCRALALLSEHSDGIQKRLTENVRKAFGLSEDILYYDCTNFYCETEEEDEDLKSPIDGDILQWGMRRYGDSKENRPNPIVQMGLLTDREGIPVAYTVNPGNTNEQTTAIPAETKMMDRTGRTGFIYCADGGLNSGQIRLFNIMHGGHYVVTQSLKTVREKDRKLIRKNMNWRYLDDGKPADIDAYIRACRKISEGKLDELTPEENEMLKHEILYKDFPYVRHVDMGDSSRLLKGRVKIEEKLWTTFSKKYFLYGEEILRRHVERAQDAVDKGRDVERPHQNSPYAVIEVTHATEEGEVAEKKIASVSQEKIEDVSAYNGFYCIATDMQDRDIHYMLDVTGNRWKIELAFRNMKSHFRTRPMYVRTEESIRGHFMMCYIALVMYQLMEHGVNKGRVSKQAAKKDPDAEAAFSADEILSTIKAMKVKNIKDSFWESEYTGSECLDALEKAFPVGLDREGYPIKRFRKD